MKDSEDYSLLRHNTFGINARCKRFIEISSLEEARQVLPTLPREQLLIIGAGSNLLLTTDYPGVVLHSNIRGTVVSENLITCGSGETWDDMVESSIHHGLYGMENLSGIPGDVGASAVQNIGAYGVEVSQFIANIEAVEIFTGKVFNISPSDCDYGYRTSKFKHEWRGRFFITHVTYRLSRDFTPQLSYDHLSQLITETSPTATTLRQAVITLRNEKLPDPHTLGNAGSFFMNPIVSQEVANKLKQEYPDMPQYDVDECRVKLSAGWLIEQCGWKGRALGRAGVYARQALVLVNLGNAEGTEILRLCHEVIHDVKERFGVQLQPEVNII